MTPTYSGADSLRARGLGVKMDYPAKCRMCEAHEVREVQQREEIEDGEELAGYLASGWGRAEAEADAWKVVAGEWRRRFWLAMFALAGVFAIVVGGRW